MRHVTTAPLDVRRRRAAGLRVACLATAVAGVALVATGAVLGLLLSVGALLVLYGVATWEADLALLASLGDVTLGEISRTPAVVTTERDLVHQLVAIRRHGAGALHTPDGWCALSEQRAIRAALDGGATWWRGLVRPSPLLPGTLRASELRAAPAGDAVWLVDTGHAVPRYVTTEILQEGAQRTAPEPVQRDTAPTASARVEGDPSGADLDRHRAEAETA